MTKKDSYNIFPVGVMRKKDKSSFIEIFDEYGDGLLGLEKFSHIIILCWFHENDTEENRNILRVHPKRDKKKPLTGVFATRSPVRPNLIALFTTKILAIKENRIYIDNITAFNGSPVIDIKPYIPKEDSIRDVEVAEWL
ncbi:tRNA (N6-threonylcarbamoyladenosine(37)-N6)-methyltransferase TrmO [Thermodesulfobacteriota bacterium]